MTQITPDTQIYMVDWNNGYRWWQNIDSNPERWITIAEHPRNDRTGLLHELCTILGEKIAIEDHAFLSTQDLCGYYDWCAPSDTAKIVHFSVEEILDKLLELDFIFHQEL